jgi:hypothetical protein
MSCARLPVQFLGMRCCNQTESEDRAEVTTFSQWQLLFQDQNNVCFRRFSVTIQLPVHDLQALPYRRSRPRPPSAVHVMRTPKEFTGNLVAQWIETDGSSVVASDDPSIPLLTTHGMPTLLTSHARFVVKLCALMPCCSCSRPRRKRTYINSPNAKLKARTRKRMRPAVVQGLGFSVWGLLHGSSSMASFISMGVYDLWFVTWVQQHGALLPLGNSPYAHWRRNQTGPSIPLDRILPPEIDSEHG